MEYTMDVRVRLNKPLTEDVLFEVAAAGGVATGNPGDAHLETTLTVDAGDVKSAFIKLLQIMRRLVDGKVIAAAILTADEADAELGLRPKIAGVTEVARMLGISRQRVSTLSKRSDFPMPLAELASGPIWRVGDLSTFASGWRRKPGRPRNAMTPSR